MYDLFARNAMWLDKTGYSFNIRLKKFDRLFFILIFGQLKLQIGPLSNTAICFSAGIAFSGVEMFTGKPRIIETNCGRGNLGWGIFVETMTSAPGLPDAFISNTFLTDTCEQDYY